jgi:hypothetical protein
MLRLVRSDPSSLLFVAMYDTGMIGLPVVGLQKIRGVAGGGLFDCCGLRRVAVRMREE